MPTPPSPTCSPHAIKLFLPQLPIILIVMALAARVCEAQVALLAGVIGLLDYAYLAPSCL